MGGRRDVTTFLHHVAVGVALVAATVGATVASAPAAGAVDTPPPFVLAWGSMGSGEGQLLGPTGVAAAPNGDVYVVDQGNDRVQRFAGDGTFISSFGTTGSGNGQFNSPYGIAVDGSGHVYVVDSGNDRVQKFTATGTFVTAWGGPGSANGQFDGALEIALNGAGTRVYVTDHANQRVQVFNAAGTFVAKWSAPGATAIDVAPNGNVYTTTSTNTVRRTTSTGALLSQWGGSGAGNGQFSFPFGLAVDPGGSVYVADYHNRVQEFSPSGTFRGSWGTAGSGDGQFDIPGEIDVDAAGNVFVTDINNNRVQRFGVTVPAPPFAFKWGTFGSAPGELDTPSDIALDSGGNVYVTDQGNDRIQKFRADGQFLAAFGSTGSGDGQFSAPRGVAVSGGGRVYVGDEGNDRVQVFDSAGTFLAAFGSPGSGNGQFNNPAGVAIGNDGDVYVADRDNSRVQRFSAAGTYLSQFGSSKPNGIDVAPNGDVYTITQFLPPTVRRFSPDGTLRSSWTVDLADASDVAVGDDGDVWVAGANGHAVRRYTADGIQRTSFGSLGFADGQMNVPHGVTVDPAGGVYVVEWSNARVQKFGSNPSVAISVSARQDRVVLGDTVIYDVAITNLGSTALTDVDVQDTAVPDCAGPAPDLDPGATHTYVCAQPAEALGAVVNQATVTATGAPPRTSAPIATRVTEGLTGTITGPSGPIDGAVVVAITSGGTPVRGAVAHPDGTYHLPVPLGSYRLAVLDPTGAHNFEYHQDATDFGGGAVVTVTADEALTVDLTLSSSGASPPATPGALGGTLTASDTDDPIGTGLVIALRLPSGLGGPISLSKAALTDGEGSFLVTGLEPGQYVLELVDLTFAHSFEWHDGHDLPSELGAGDVVTVTASNTTTVDLDMAPA